MKKKIGIVIAAVVALTLGLSPAAHAVGTAPTTLTLTAPATVPAGTGINVQVTLTGATAPVTVYLLREGVRTGASWRQTASNGITQKRFLGITSSAVGNYALEAEFAGSATHAAATLAQPVPFAVVPVETSIAVTGFASVPVGETISGRVLLEGASGDVQVTLRDSASGESVDQLIPVELGTVEDVSFAGIPAGNYTVTAAYAGTAKIAPASSTVTSVSVDRYVTPVYVSTRLAPVNRLTVDVRGAAPIESDVHRQGTATLTKLGLLTSVHDLTVVEGYGHVELAGLILPGSYQVVITFPETDVYAAYTGSFNVTF